MTVVLDHLVYGVPDLHDGVAAVARRTGVEPALGGAHPLFGTRNALVALGPDTYLELLAVDPWRDRRPVALGVLVEALPRPTMVSFAARVADADGFAEEAMAANYVAEVTPGSRMTPDGHLLEWRNVTLSGHRFGPFMPFFIEWGSETPHPARSSPKGCELEALEVCHPEAQTLGAEYEALGLGVQVRTGARPSITATLSTPGGTIVLH